MLRRDKALLESLTKKYGRNELVNEMSVRKTTKNVLPKSRKWDRLIDELLELVPSGIHMYECDVIDYLTKWVHSNCRNIDLSRLTDESDEFYNLQSSLWRSITEDFYIDDEDDQDVLSDIVNDGYDVTMTFNASDPMKPFVTMDADQVASDEGSFFGISYGDDKLLVTNSSLYDSIFYPCGRYLYIWTEMYVENLGVPVGTVGHFYNIMEWISDEEAERLMREGM